MDYNDVLHHACAKEIRNSSPVTEDNWKSRMDFCNKMTAAIDTHGTGDKFPKDFHIQIEPYLNNVLDCAISERTQLSLAATKLLTALPKVLGRDMHPHIDRVLPVLIKLCANTKQVIVKVAAVAVASVVQHSTFSPRLLYHVCRTFEEKPAGPKQHATSWLSIIMKDYHRSITSNKDIDAISRALTLALEDADAGVRTSSRATYWLFNKIDPNAAAEIMEKLNKQARTALQNDPHNPDKKSAPAKAAPPRPKSALADVRKEQARRKKAEEEAAAKQRKPFASSTASNDLPIEIHEPVKPKVKATKESAKSETARSATPGLDDKRHKDWHRVAADAKKTHKKALSNDDEVITKQSTNSRLLSAPVRRPRINVTPLNHDSDHAQTSARPGSRAELASHSVQARETKRLDSRPASSSSTKSAPTGIYNTVSSRAQAVQPPYMPEGKENAAASHSSIASSKKSRPPTATPSPEKSIQDLKSSISSSQSTQSTSPRSLPDSQKTLYEKPFGTPYEGQYDPRGAVSYQSLASIEKVETTVPSPDHPGYIDLKMAQKFLEYGVKDLGVIFDDPIRCKRLKASIEQHPTLIPDQETWNLIFEEISFSLADINELNSDSHVRADWSSNARSNPYTRQLLLQMSIPLLKYYPQWSVGRVRYWTWAMIIYRCSLPNDPRDRRSELCMRNVDRMIRNYNAPLAFINSALQAIEAGEKTILDGFESKKSLVERRMTATGDAARSQEMFDVVEASDNRPVGKKIKADVLDLMEPGGGQKRVLGQKWYEPTAYRDELIGTTQGSENIDAVLAEDQEDPEFHQRMADAADRLMLHLKKTVILHSEPATPTLPYPKTLPLLYDTGLQVLELCLTEARARGQKLRGFQERQLCELAKKCLESYDYMIKRSVIPYVRALYNLMEDRTEFFGYFKEEGTRNLLEYYLFEH